MFGFFTRKLRAELADARLEVEYLRRDRARLIETMFEVSDG